MEIDGIVGAADQAMTSFDKMSGLTVGGGNQGPVSIIGLRSNSIGVKNHEAIHVLFKQISQKYGAHAESSVVSELVKEVSSEVKDKLKAIFIKYGSGVYNSSDEDEILAWMYTFMTSRHAREKVGMSREMMSAIKRDWKRVVRRAAKFTPEKLQGDSLSRTKRVFMKYDSDHLKMILDEDLFPEDLFPRRNDILRDILRERGDL